MRSIHRMAATTVILASAWACGDGGGVTPPPDNIPPTADFTAACTALVCTFTNTSADQDGTFTSHWEFGDQGVSDELSPVHTYGATDVTPYTIKLTVTDNAGAKAEKSQSITVTPAATLKCASGSDCTIDLAQPATLTVTLTSRDCQFVGNAFAITAPIQQTVFTDGCSELAGTVYTINGGTAFSAGTKLEAQFTQGAGAPSDPPKGAPALRLSQITPSQWKIEYDDGGDPTGIFGPEPDFNDIVLTVDATFQ